MFQPHPAFSLPEDPDCFVWRYLKLNRFLALLKDGTLFFSRADRFEDPYEGMYTPETIAFFEQRGLDREGIRSFSQDNRGHMAISCWHMNDYESAAMWRLYTRDKGIAVRTTYARLCSSFDPEPRTMHVGVVQYIDYSTYGSQAENLYYPFLHKRRSFEYEREVRALVNGTPVGSWELGDGPGIPGNGIDVRVNLPTLIESVFVAPTVESTVVDEVKAALRDCGMVDVADRVVQSDLYSDPVY